MSDSVLASSKNTEREREPQAEGEGSEEEHVTEEEDELHRQGRRHKARHCRIPLTGWHDKPDPHGGRCGILTLGSVPLSVSWSHCSD